MSGIDELRLQLAEAQQERDKWRADWEETARHALIWRERAERHEERRFDVIELKRKVRCERDAALAALAEIAENAEAWHGPEQTGHTHALRVIAQTARLALAGKPSPLALAKALSAAREHTRCKTCDDRGEVAATPGMPQDGPMECPDCSRGGGSVNGEREWEVEPYECDCGGPWMIDGFVYRADDPLLTQRPRWPYTTPHRVYHLASASVASGEGST